MNMQVYRWPGFELQLLRELQRQQNSALFCDTLLQTEGISVPTHSCVLAALSPYLYQKLSSIPSPPAGQKRQLRLQAVKPCTLLKLVSLLYSGQLEVKGLTEQDDVLATARRFGFTKLVEGHVDRRRKEEERRRWSSGRSRGTSVQDAQVQAELAERRRRSCVSIATQTDDGKEMVEYQSKQSTPKAPVSPQQHGVQSEKQLGPDGLLISCDETAASRHPVESFHSEFVTKLKDSLQSGDGDGAGPEAGGGDGSVAEREEAGNSKRDEGAEEELMKSVATVKLMETAHISVKVKLKRRTQGEVWEVVGMQAQDEKLSVHRSLKQDRSRHASPQREAQLHKPSESLCFQFANVHGPEQSEQLGPESRLLPDRSPRSELEHQGPLEESDEQIQKLLEDIMMGLNILPGLEGGCRKPQPADTGFHFGLESPSCTSMSNTQPPVQNQGGDSTSSQNTSSSEQQTSLHPGEQDLVATTDYFSGGQKRGYSPSEQTSRQDILDLLPLSNGSNSDERFSFAYMDDLPLLPCVSPLASSCTSAAKHPDSDAQSKLRRRPWLKEEPDLLQFPLCTMTNAETKYFPLDACAPSCSVARGEDEESAAARKLQPKTTANSSNSEQCGTKGHDSAPRRRTRKRRNHSQHTNCCFLSSEESKVDDRTKSVCLVNLSSNNVLVSKKESSPRLIENPQESLREKTAGPADPSSGWTRIRTRGFVRRSQELGDAVMEQLVSAPLVRRANLVKRPDPLLPKRGRGRPRKVKLGVNQPVSFPAVIKMESVDVGPEEQRAEREKCGKRRKKIDKLEEIPLKRITRSTSTDMAVTEGGRNPETSEPSQRIPDTLFSTVDESKPISESAVAWSGKQLNELNGSSQETGVDNEGHSESCSSVCSNEFTREETGRRQSPLAAEEEISCVNGGSDTVSETATAGRRSPSKEDEEAAIAPTSEAEVIQMTTCSIQEDSEDVEVDVLFCSPDKSPLIREFEDTFHGIVTPDKEEEKVEEEEEVDVTGE